MRTHLTILAALVLATPLTAQTSFGVRGGMTLSTFAVSEDDDEVELTYQPGFHFGAAAALGSGGPGVLLSAAYAQRGTALRSKSGLDPGDDFDLEGSIDVAYVDVGALGRFSVGGGPYLLVGPTLSLRVACSVTLTDLFGNHRDRGMPRSRG